MTPLLVAALLAAPRPFDLSDAQGARHRLEDYRGKIVLVNFWATFCEPCREELPSLERLRKTLAGKPFAILAVQMGGSARTAQDVASDLGLHFPLLLDRDSRVTKAFGVQVLPATFVFGPDGALLFERVGETDWSSARWRRKIESLRPPKEAPQH